MRRMRLMTRVKKYIAALVTAAVLGGGGYGAQDFLHGTNPQIREVAAVVTQKGKTVLKKIKNIQWADIENLAHRLKRAYDAF